MIPPMLLPTPMPIFSYLLRLLWGWLGGIEMEVLEVEEVIAESRL